MTRDGLNIGLLHMGYVLQMQTLSNPCIIYFEVLNNIGSFSSVL